MTPTALSISSLSSTHAAVGTSITITGAGFGAARGNSFVVFGERINAQGWAPCARKAAVQSWSNSSIRVTVPAMSPGKAGYPSTYHNVYVVLNPVGTWAPDYYSASASRTLHKLDDEQLLLTSTSTRSSPSRPGRAQPWSTRYSRPATWNPATATYTTTSARGAS